MVTTKVKEESEKIARYADKLVSIAGEWPSGTKTDNLARISSRLRRRAKDLRKDEFQLAVVGNYSSGKSTLINALLGKKVLGVDRLPETGVVTYVRHVNSFDRVRRKLTVGKEIEVPEETFGVVRFSDVETNYDEDNVKEDLKSFLRSDEVVNNTNGVGGIVAGLDDANIENIRQLIDQLLSGKGPSSGGYWSSQVSPERLKEIAKDVVNDEGLVEAFTEWRDKLAKPPEEVEKGTKIVKGDEMERYVAKRKDNSDKQVVVSDYVDQIDVFVDSDLLEDGGVLVDLPGANTADSRDAEITLDYLGTGRVDAVLLVVDFEESAGLDKTMSQLVEKIQTQDRSVTERLFMAINKVDKGFSSPVFSDLFLDTYEEYYEEYIQRERVYFLSSIINFFLSDVDPVYKDEEPSDEDIKEAMKEIVSNNKNGEESPEWVDFRDALSGYAQEYSSHVDIEGDTFDDGLPSKMEIVEYISEEHPDIIKDASRLKGVEKDIPSVPSENVGTHVMYSRLIEYIHKTQYENKLRRLRKDAESISSEIVDILSSVSKKLNEFPDSREELSKEREFELRDSFRDAQDNVHEYVSRVAIKAKDKFEEEGLKQFEKKTRNISDLARDITNKVNIKRLQSQIENRDPVSEEEIRLCEELEVKEYREDVKQGYFAEEVLSELVDMALRITAARLRQAVEGYIEGLYEELRSLMRSDEVMFDPDSGQDRLWNRSFLNSLKKSDILDSSQYEAYVEKDVLQDIKEKQLMSGSHNVSRLHPDDHSNWLSIYSGLIDEEETQNNPDMPAHMERLVNSDKLDEEACRRVAENVLKDISTEFIEKFNNREIGLYKSLTTNTLSEDTLSSRLEDMLDPSGELYSERIDELKDKLEGNYKSMKEDMINKYDIHSPLYKDFKDTCKKLGDSLREVEEGFTVNFNDLPEEWSKVEDRYQQKDS